MLAAMMVGNFGGLLLPLRAQPPPVDRESVQSPPPNKLYETNGEAELRSILNQGFEDTRPMIDPEANGFLPYQGFSGRHGISAPIARRLIIEPAIDNGALFVHETWVRLPEDKSIEVVKHEEDGRDEKWNLPEETEILDIIRMRDDRNSLFEWRIAKKIASHRWAFAQYRPSRDKTGNESLFLMREPELINLVIEKNNRLYRVSGQRMNPQGCIYCHSRNAPDGLPEPYGFAPRGKGFLTSWISAFETKTGRNPFVFR